MKRTYPPFSLNKLIVAITLLLALSQALSTNTRKISSGNKLLAKKLKEKKEEAKEEGREIVDKTSCDETEFFKKCQKETGYWDFNTDTGEEFWVKLSEDEPTYEALEGELETRKVCKAVVDEDLGNSDRKVNRCVKLEGKWYEDKYGIKRWATSRQIGKAEFEHPDVDIETEIKQVCIPKSETIDICTQKEGYIKKDDEDDEEGVWISVGDASEPEEIQVENRNYKEEETCRELREYTVCSKHRGFYYEDEAGDQIFFPIKLLHKRYISFNRQKVFENEICAEKDDTVFVQKSFGFWKEVKGDWSWRSIGDIDSRFEEPGYECETVGHIEASTE